MPCSSLITSQNCERSGRPRPAESRLAGAGSAPDGRASPPLPSPTAAGPRGQPAAPPPRAAAMRGAARPPPPSFPLPVCSQALARPWCPAAHLGADLVAALASLQVHDLPHGGGSGCY